MIQQKQEDEAVLKACGPSVLQSQPSVPSQNEDASSTLQSIQSSAPTQNMDASSTLQTVQSPAPTLSVDTRSTTLQSIQLSTQTQNKDSSSTLQSTQSSAPTQNGDSTAPTQIDEASSIGQSIPSSSQTNQQEIGPGWKIAFDNLDIFQRVREMTEDNQNKDHHWINHVKVTNRVSGNHLPDDKPICDSVMDLDNYKIIPTVPQHISQRGNYILLIERVITEEIPCLAFCKDVVTLHIPHAHSKEMAKKSEKVGKI